MMRNISLLALTFFFSVLITTDLYSSSKYIFTSRGSIDKTELEFGILAIDERGVNFSPVALADKKFYYAFFLEDESILNDNLKLESIARDGKDLISLFSIAGQIYDPILLLLSSNNSNIKILDQISPSKMNDNLYTFLLNMSPLTIKDKVAYIDSITKNIELDFTSCQFRLFLIVTDGKLEIDFTPAIYEKQFKDLSRIDVLDEYQFREYLLYGLITSNLSERQARKILKEREKKDEEKISLVIENTINVKNIATEFQIGGDLLVAYFSKQANISDISNILSDVDTERREKFFKLMIDIETTLYAIGVDEFIFNDFAEYFNGNITEKEFKKYTKLSFDSMKCSMRSILVDYKNIDKALHEGKRKIIIKKYKK